MMQRMAHRFRSVQARALTACAIAVGLAACTEARDRPTVPFTGDLAIFSEPSGASIRLDSRGTGTTTPDTINATSGAHELDLLLDAGSDEIFRWTQDVVVPEERLGVVNAALEGGCVRDCPFSLERGRVICIFNTRGDTCASFFSGVPALRWLGDQGGGGGDYGSGGRLLAAAIMGSDAGAQAGDTLATQFFRDAWTGRVPVSTAVDGRREVVQLEYWATARFFGSSILGLAVEETIVAVDSATVEDIVFVHFRVTNVSNDPRYQVIYPVFPTSGATFVELYLGFGLDADVGAAADDLASFEADSRLGFIYDADFSDSELGASGPPALVGLLTLEAPAGTADRTLTLWRSSDDWDDGSVHDRAWRILAGKLGPMDPIADHPSPDFGFVSDDPADYRLTEGLGPFSLAPGESVELAVALLFARPTPGSFTEGQVVTPGDPIQGGRPILDVAADLLDLAAAAPELWQRYRP